MKTTDVEFPLALGDRVRIISLSSSSYGEDGEVIELPDVILLFRVKLFNKPFSDNYPQNPGYYARHALCFISAKPR